MSYAILQSMSIDKDGNIFVTVEDNNVFPKEYERVRYTGNINDLVYDFMSGNIQPQWSANNGKVLYIVNQMRENLKGFSDDAIKTSPKVAFAFKQMWRDSKANENYIVKFQDYYITAKKKYGFQYSPNQNSAKVFNFYQASNLLYDNPRNNLKMMRV